MPTSSRNSGKAARTLGSAGIACALGAGTLLGLSGTASAAVPTEQTMDSAPSSVDEGTTVTFRGTLSGLGDRPLSGEDVTLQWRGGQGQPWQEGGSDTTNDKGVAAIQADVDRTAQWRISYPGDRLNDPAASKPVTVKAEQSIGERLVETAAAQAGESYSYGASGPDSFDCSGLTQYVHKQHGIDLPRTSGDQRAALPEIAKDDKRPGDLIFFADGGSVYHVGIYAGGNTMWAAPEPGDVVREQEIWTDAYTVGRAW
ncbi:Cell wall-associated hydrolase, NlpC family [Amycolatopsis marina]|uniref:Cell wall-associated hydrolase, NlpC family n=1 Tax=Amycolatopsis marina TaxID=490629 RepID=A0A1I0ZR27_9PSEU|nr:Cell wall-associated hydrolase, NlpC family [Amycolatopsis marina]